MVTESVRKILSEEQTLIDNFDMASKLLDVQTPDDFHFVQIIKRFKDNPNDDKTKGKF